MGYSPWSCERVRHDLATKQQWRETRSIVKTICGSLEVLLRDERVEYTMFHKEE